MYDTGSLGTAPTTLHEVVWTLLKGLQDGSFPTPASDGDNRKRAPRAGPAQALEQSPPFYLQLCGHLCFCRLEGAGMKLLQLFL